MQLNLSIINIKNSIFFLLLSMPLCAIAGNLFINLNIVLTSILGLFLIIKNQRFSFLKENLELVLLSFFFSYKFFHYNLLSVLNSNVFFDNKIFNFYHFITYFLEKIKIY